MVARIGRDGERVLGAMGNVFVCHRSEEETRSAPVCEIMEILTIRHLFARAVLNLPVLL